MFAHIYPLLRLPRRFGAFDYRIAPDADVRVGDIVRIPFNRRTTLGVVADVTPTTDVMGELQTVDAVAYKAALDANDVRRIETIAQSIAQSPSTILTHTVGVLAGETAAPRTYHETPNELRLPREAAEDITAALTMLKGHDRIAAQLSIDATLAAAQILRRHINGQLLIVVPRERDAELIAKTIPFSGATTLLHGRTPPKERERVVRAWRSGSTRTLIGTRQAALLPAQQLGAVVIVTSGTDDHFNDRKNPRLDTRLLAEAQAVQHGAKLLVCDWLPRPEEATAFPCAYSKNPVSAEIIDLKKPEEQRDEALLSETLLGGIKTALQSKKKVLLFYNRKGVAKRAQCKACQTVVVCARCNAVPTPCNDVMLQCSRCGATQEVPARCPACQHGKVGLKGIGNAHIAADLAQCFPNVHIGRIEKGHVNPGDMTLVTEYFFSSVATPFAKKEYGLVADVCADLSLTPDNFRGAEDAARKLHRLDAFAKQQGAQCLVQTWLPDVIDGMRDAQTFTESELALRNAYELPPYRAVVTVRHADAAALEAVTGVPFVADDAHMLCAARIAPPALSSFLFPLSSLPDTAVISIAQGYVHHSHPPQSQP